MTKHVYTNDALAIFPSVGVWVGQYTWELHLVWFRKELVLTFKKKKRNVSR